MPVTLLEKWMMLRSVALDRQMTAACVEVSACLLHHHNNKTDQCNPSYATIAEWTGLNRATVIKSVKVLEVAGYLRIIRTVDKGEQASKGQRLPSNTFVFDFSRADRSEIATTPSRKSRPPWSENPTTSVDNSDHPQSAKPTGGSRKTRPKDGNIESGKLEDGNETSNPVTRNAPETRSFHTDPELFDSSKNCIGQSEADFDNWYRLYPKKRAPRDAEAVFNRLLKAREVTAEVLIEKVKAFSTYWQHRLARDPTDRKYIPDPATWLRKGRWDDELDDLYRQPNFGRAQGAVTELQSYSTRREPR